jgi:undecaprenyl-diphosphatase
VPKSTRLPVIATCALLVFAWLAFIVHAGRTQAFDDSVRQTIHLYATPALTAIMRVFTFIGTSGFFAMVGALVVWWLIKAGCAAAAIWFIAVQISANLILKILQFAFHRARPEPFFGLSSPETYSFPSGHAMLSTVFYLSLATLLTRKTSIRIAAALLAFFIGLSRIYLGVHYPTDVLAGFAAAAFWLSAWVTCILSEWRLPHDPVHLRHDQRKTLLS